MFLRLAYLALLAASIALRLTFAYPHASASDLVQRADTSADASAAEANSGAQAIESAPLITGRSVAAPKLDPRDAITPTEARAHDGVGAAGFARR
jgi:hypothetical protein